MASNFALKAVITLSIFASVNCVCKSTTYIATESGQDIAYFDYKSNEECSFEIKPHYNRNKYFDYSKYLENWKKYTGYEQHFEYFLEISWKSFNVRGKMPNCNNDYVEIFLTRSEKSIGRFCSDNLIGSSLFKMYSYDGYAKIKLHSDGSINGKGFKFNIRLRRASSDYLQYNRRSTCNVDFASSFGNLFSPNWPYEYNIDTNEPCTLKVDSEGEKKIVLMDVSLKRSSQGAQCSLSQDDSIQIRGSSSSSASFQAATEIKSPICATNTAVSITTSHRYVYIRLSRQKYGSSERGVVAGYVTYKKDGSASKDSSSSSSSSPSINWLVVILSTAGSLCFIVIVIGITCCCCFKRKKALSTKASASTTPNVTYSSFQPSIGYQGPYQSSQTHIGDAPPAYSSYQSTFPTQTHFASGGRQALISDDVYYRSPPAYNPEYAPSQQQDINTPHYYNS